MSVHFLSLQVKSCCCSYSMKWVNLNFLYLLCQASSWSSCTKHLTRMIKGFPPVGEGAGWVLKKQRNLADVTLQLMFLYLTTSLFGGLHIQLFWKTQIFLPSGRFSQSHLCQGHRSLFPLWICPTLKTRCGSIDLMFNFRHTNTITELWKQS